VLLGKWVGAMLVVGLRVGASVARWVGKRDG